METIDNLPFSGKVSDDTIRMTIIAASQASLFRPHVHMFSTAPSPSLPHYAKILCNSCADL